MLPFRFVWVLTFDTLCAWISLKNLAHNNSYITPMVAEGPTLQSGHADDLTHVVLARLTLVFMQLGRRCDLPPRSVVSNIVRTPQSY